MAYYGPSTPPELGVSRNDIQQAIQRIKNEGLQYECQSRYEGSVVGESAPAHVGIHKNEWQMPITEFGGDCAEWVVNLKRSAYVGEIDFGKNEWARSREAVDTVMNLILKEIRLHAQKYERLRIDNYVRQGSSRDGLKVIAPDEFDTMLEFHLEGLENCINQGSITKDGRRVPGFCKVAIFGKSMTSLERTFPKLYKEEVFIENSDGIFLSSKFLHQRVFESMIDTTCRTISDKITSYNRTAGRSSNFSIKRKMNPPAINITIQLDDGSHQYFMPNGQPRNTSVLVKEIDIDIVPALLLRYDNNTTYDGYELDCPIHAVCKWAEDNSFKALEFVDQRIVWDVKTTGYEKHALDVARQDRRKLYILTALRIVKTYFTRTKTIAKEAGHAPPQIVSVLKSYHLKQIAFYLLYYLCHKYPHFRVHTAQRALLHFINILEATLEEKHLPHFFYSNNDVVSEMFPGFPKETDRRLRYDLFRKIPNESLNRARQSLNDHLIPNLGFEKGDGDGYEDPEMATVGREFRSSIPGGNDHLIPNLGFRNRDGNRDGDPEIATVGREFRRLIGGGEFF